VALLDAAHESGQTIAIWRGGTDLHTFTLFIKQAVVQTLPTEIQTDVQQTNGPPLRSFVADTLSVPPRRPPSSHSEQTTKRV
jgi:hypothetical protein